MSFSTSIQTELTVESFWRSVHILLTKPHVINKRLWGSKIWFQCDCWSKTLFRELPTTYHLEDFITNENIETCKRNILNELKLCCSDNTNNFQDTVEVILFELLSKNYTDKQAYQLACFQKNKSTIIFYNVTPVNWKQNQCPDFRYRIQLDQKEVILTAFIDKETKSYQWLANILLPQFVKWGRETVCSKTKTTICTESLALVSKTKYYEKYKNLKLKYGKEMVQIWPECTDPSKFVYEDVAIAAYLLLLWENDASKKKKSFLDLGCGNGLLVYILTKEGHSGVGLDVRKRNVWDLYPPDIILQEKTITPSDISKFPDVDWIIGNHSDELTPWIPVIAAKTSFKCNFFLLPCCAYNFDGSKYQRKNSYNSQYFDYLGYIKQLCKDCGFKVNTDRLKIPSTKRICIVSNSRIYSQVEHDTYCEKIDNIINIETNITQGGQSQFKARENVEKVRNCTQVDKNVINEIVSIITKYLLAGCNETDAVWSKGKTTEINELVHQIPQDLLNILKSECGGLQTLLKNNHNIFKVVSGMVELRYPKTINEMNIVKRKPNQSTIKVKQKACWFYGNHPQGCPLQDADCSFLHVR